MGFLSSLIKRLLKCVLYITIFITIIVLIPNLPPYTKFTSIELEPTQQGVGPLAPNGILNNIEKLYLDKVLGPETFQLHNGEIYTSLATGEIVKISPGGHVTFVTKVGQPCAGLVKEHICGRPLGFKIDEKNNQLYIADAYHGIWKVDLKTDKKQLLVSPRVEIGGRQPKLFNDVAISKNGDFYWTDSTSDFYLKDGMMSTLSDPSGRIFHYNSAKNESKVLLDDIWFANGVVISPDNQFIVVAETCKYRLLKYYINGPKKGKSEIFVAGLPGIPDNIRVLPDGSGVLVALYNAFNEDNPLLLRSIAQFPAIRKFVARIQRLIEIPIEFLNSQYPLPVFEDIVYHIGHFKSASALSTQISGLVQIDWNGNIVASYFNTDGSIAHISDAILYNNKLYLGSPHKQNFIAAVPAPPLLKKAFTSVKSSAPSHSASKESQPKVDTKPEQAKPVDSLKSKAEEKKEAPSQSKPSVAAQEPKRTTHKSVPQESKPAQRKPSETGKTSIPKPTSKPTEPKQTIPAPVEAKSTVSKPAVGQSTVTTTPSKQAETKPSTPKSVESKQTTPEQAKAKSTPPPKQAETKPTTPPKQAETKPSTPPKQAETKPATPPKQAETKPTTPPKQAETKPITPPKQTETKPTTPPKPVESKTARIKTEEKPAATQNMKATSKPVLDEIPIKEEIPSDTVKPTKDTLKVIKKNGPTEIPNPNL